MRGWNIYIGAVCAVAVMGASAALADFKRVTPPKPGSTQKRITVQIDPLEQAAILSRSPKPSEQDKTGEVGDEGAAAAPKPSPGGRYGWFWESISPDLAQTGPGRLRLALDKLGNPPSGESAPNPRLAALGQIAQAQGVAILRATIGTEVSPALALAVIAVESAGRVDAVSGAGAQGLMQLMPDTATRFGVEDALAADQNIKGGVAFLDFLMKKFDGDPILVLAGYNAGENSIGNHGGVPPFAETRDYVPKVLAAFKVARGLCLTPPELVSDGCVFVKIKG